MKHTTIILALLALSVITISSACQQGSGTSQSNANGPSSSPVAALSPSPESSPTPEQPRSGDLDAAISSGDVAYEMSGIDSTQINLTVQNKSDRIWEVKIEVGTKLEPDSSDVQRMVVTKEVHVHLEPHHHDNVELDASCLDISKAAPSQSDTAWQIRRSPALAQFINCANNAITDAKSEEDRADLIQFSIWQARGATHDQWVHFWSGQGLSSDGIEHRIAEYEPRVTRVTSRVLDGTANLDFQLR
ncbi:MAG: hypothetical protein QOE96_2459 [Blastocatellia bacterium]|jgi:hypothetical protein|nr:hypothetical protein [Blastocatellia bacterium]